MTMRHWLHGTVLLAAIGMPASANASDVIAQRESLVVELTADFPKPPKRLDTDTATSAVLLIDFRLTKELGQSRVTGVTLLSDSAGLIRAQPIKGNLVMFHTLAPGRYSLQFIRVDVYIGGDLEPRETRVLGRPPAVTIDATVTRGGLHYLGTVVVTGRVNLWGSKPPDIKVTYDAHRELEAWTAFTNKYADSPWRVLADRRITTLRSSQ